eukprot:12465430-Alexandrium_andersonii.AAC.1
MESVLYEACRLLDIPAPTRVLLPNEGQRISLDYPVMAGLVAYKQPLLVAAVASHPATGSSARPPAPPPPVPPTDRPGRMGSVR